MIRFGLIGAALLGFSMVALLADGKAEAPIPPLPATPKKPVTEMYFSTHVVDNYRWLENAGDPAVRQWTEAQNRRTRAMLDQYRPLPALRAQIKELISHQSPNYNGLTYAGGRLFALKTQPPKEHPFLSTLPSPDDPAFAQVIVDPNRLNPKGTTAIDFYVPSLDGKLVAVSLSEGGSEEGTVHVYEVAGGKEVGDVIPRVNGATAGGSLAWNAEGTGFYYTRYPRGDERPKADLDFFQQVYYHKLGTPTGEDRYVIGKEFPRIAEVSLKTTDDGRYLLATVANGDGGEFAHYLMNPAGQWTQLTRFADEISGATFGPDQELYLFSRKDAPRGKILRLSLETPEVAKAKVVVPESEAAIEGEANGLTGHGANFVPTAHRLYVVDQVGGPSQVRVFDHDGRLLQTVPLPPVAAVHEPLRLDGDALLFHVERFLEPPAWYRFDPMSRTATRTALYRTAPVRFDDAEVVREFATSKDGTRVPLNIIQPKGLKLDGRNPTLLTGYGGFSISETPSFSSLRRLWLNQGGVVVVANLRGGTEYGEEWHKAGSRTHKQNVFDDFAACAQLLIDRKITSPDRLAIQGDSNGGLLMGAVLTQHPELFRAVVAQVGIFDMLLHDRHPNGAFNVPEYGTAKDQRQFQALYAYSPYQHVKDGTPYPAVFLLTGANDGRVDPANSRKMAACLQAATSSQNPILLEVSYDSGHGAGTSLSKAIAQQADIHAFLFQQLGIDYRPGPK
jgi:prolyl oligopeptidase